MHTITTAGTLRSLRTGMAISPVASGTRCDTGGRNRTTNNANTTITPGHHAEGEPPSEGVPEGRAERHPEHERRGASRVGHRDRARQLMTGNQPGGVRPGDRPEQAVRESAQDARAHQEAVGRRDRAEHVRDSTSTPSSSTISHLRENRRVSTVSGAVLTTTVPAKIVTSSPTWDSRDVQLGRDIRKQTGGQELARHRDEDRPGDDEQHGKAGMVPSSSRPSLPSGERAAPGRCHTLDGVSGTPLDRHPGVRGPAGNRARRERRDRAGRAATSPSRNSSPARTPARSSCGCRSNRTHRARSSSWP